MKSIKPCCSCDLELSCSETDVAIGKFTEENYDHL